MNIYKAAKYIEKNGGYMTLPSCLGSVYIKPTNLEGNCIVITEASRSKYGWQPKLSDLVRKDWIVVKEEGFGGDIYG